MNIKHILMTAALVAASLLSAAGYAQSISNYQPLRIVSGTAAISGTATAGRIAVWNTSNTITSDPSLTYSGGLITTGTVRLSDGTASAPSLAAASNTGVGVYFTTGNTLLIASSNGRRFGLNNQAAAFSVPVTFGIPESLMIGNIGQANMTVSGTAWIGYGQGTPSATLHIASSATTAGIIIPNCSTTISCGANTAGKMCYRPSNNTVYQCDGAGSAAPFTYGTKVSATTLN